MSVSKRILLIWASLLPLGIVSSLMNPVEYAYSILTLYAVGTLAGIVSFYIFRRETERGTRALFLNFFIFFGPWMIVRSTWQLVREKTLQLDRYADVYATQYSWALTELLLCVCVVYLFVDSVLMHKKIYQKYILTFAVVGSTWGYLFYPYFENPKFLYTTPDAEDYKALDKVLTSLNRDRRSRPTLEEISSQVRLYERMGDRIVGELNGIRKEQRIARLLPYMEGTNYTSLVYRPLFLNGFYLSLLCLAFITLYFFYHYVHDPPKSAYIEKIVLLLLPFCAFEALHCYAFSTSVTVAGLATMDLFGRFVTAAVIMMLLWVFVQRLKFVLSAEGKFYERRVVHDPGHITRWRDSIDNWIVHRFLNPKVLQRRFLLLQKKNT